MVEKIGDFDNVGYRLNVVNTFVTVPVLSLYELINSYLAEGRTRLIRSVCISVAFFKTSEYTRFFSLEGALRINSENLVDSMTSGFFDFENRDIIFTLPYTKHMFNIGAIVFFWNVIVNFINIGLIRSVRIVIILEQQINPNIPFKF